MSRPRPHRAVVGVAGAFFVMMVMGAVIFGAIALPILTGLGGGDRRERWPTR